MRGEANDSCDSCGEEIVVPIDLSAGMSQEYTEDCPVCCCPNIIHVEIDEDGDVRVWAEKSKMVPLHQDPCLARGRRDGSRSLPWAGNSDIMLLVALFPASALRGQPSLNERSPAGLGSAWLYS